MIVLSGIAILVLYQLSVFLSKRSNKISVFLSKCGNSSLSMLGFHRPIWLFVYPICLKLGLGEYMFTLVEMITAVPIILILDKIFNKYAPALIGKKVNINE